MKVSENDVSVLDIFFDICSTSDVGDTFDNFTENINIEISSMILLQIS